MRIKITSITGVSRCLCVSPPGLFASRILSSPSRVSSLRSRWHVKSQVKSIKLYNNNSYMLKTVFYKRLTVVRAQLLNCSLY